LTYALLIFFVAAISVLPSDTIKIVEYQAAYEKQLAEERAAAK